MRLKRFYSSREVASLTGLTARQLQWWDARRLFSAAVATKKTEAGGFTERRYSPLDVIELQLLADLLRRGFSVPQIRHLLAALRDVFGVRLYEVIGEEGPLTLMIAGDELYVRDADGHLFDLADPAQALLVEPDEKKLRPLAVRERRKRTSGSERLSRGRRPASE